MEVPSTQQISDDLIAQLEASLSQTSPLLPKAFLRVAAKTLAGLFILLWKYCGFIFQQMFIADATLNETTIAGKVVRPLKRWGDLAGVSPPVDAVAAEFTVDVTVIEQVGTLPVDTALLSPTSAVYLTTVPRALDAATVDVTVRAVDAGADATQVGDVLSFADSVPHVAREATVAGVDVVGVDAESQESYRARVLAHFRERPKGGAYADYREWGESVDGIAHVYPYESTKPGEIDVFVEVDTDVDPDGLPDAGYLAAVADAIELNGVTGKASRRPLGAAVTTRSIGRVAWLVTIHGLAVDPAIEESVKTDLQDALDEYFRSREPFIVGLSDLPRADMITKAAVAGIVDTVVSAAGGTVNDVSIFYTAGDERTSYQLAPGEKAKLFIVPGVWPRFI